MRSRYRKLWLAQMLSDSASEPSAASSAEPSAASKVLAIPELLEQILLGVDKYTLFNSQRVNKSFHANIKGSKKLQQALWYREVTPSGKQTHSITLNPFVFEPLSLLEPFDPVDPSGDVTFRFAFIKDKFWARINCRSRLSDDRASLVIRCHESILTASLASWEKMLIARTDVGVGLSCRVHVQTYCGGEMEICGHVEERFTVGELLAWIRAESQGNERWMKFKARSDLLRDGWIGCGDWGR